MKKSRFTTEQIIGILQEHVAGTAPAELMRRHGISRGRIRVGVRLEDGQFLAHAWVELGDLILADAPRRVRAFQSIAEARITS